MAAAVQSSTLNFFERIKTLTDWIPGKELVAPAFRPIIHRIKYRRDNRNFLLGGKDALIAAKTALDGIGVPFWLDFGTLLGITRDGELIRHDTDVDIAVLHENFSPLIREAMVNAGFRLTEEYLIDDGNFAREECYVYQNVGLDIFYYHREHTEMYCHLFPKVDGKPVTRELRMRFSGFSDFTYDGEKWLVPTDYHQRLIDTYGENYHIPDPNFHTPTDAFNSRDIARQVTHINHEE